MENNLIKRQAQNRQYINLYELFMVFWQNKLLIIIVAVIGAVAAGLITHFAITPTYTASSDLYIVSASSGSMVNLSDLQLGTSLTADYKRLVLSTPMLESTIENLGLKEYSPKSLKKMIDVTNESGTRILEITVTSTDPNLSAAVANEMARLAVNWLPEMMESPEPNIIEYAAVPTSRSGPSLSRNVAMGILIGAFLSMAYLTVRYMLDDTVSTAEDLEKYFGLTPLTVIPENDAVFESSSHHAGSKKK